MLLELIEALRARVERWRLDAASIERYDSDDSKAKTLVRCARDLEELLDAHRPEWVNVKDVIVSTGRSRSYLQSMCRRELIHRGLARKTPRGWEIALEEAMRIPRKRQEIQIDPRVSIEELARRFAQEE